MFKITHCTTLTLLMQLLQTDEIYLMAHLNTYNDKYLAIMCQEKVSMINFQHWTNAQSKAIVCLQGRKIQSESL